MREQGIASARLQDDEQQFEASLRPRRLDDFTGQAKLKENLTAFIEAVNAARPREAKGQYIRSATLTTTMGPGIHLDLAQTLGLRSA